jgi:omega-amidase
MLRTLMSAAPAFKPFRLSLVQLGQVGPDKTKNLSHARDMLLKAANVKEKPDLIVLPVSRRRPMLYSY